MFGGGRSGGRALGRCLLISCIFIVAVATGCAPALAATGHVLDAELSSISGLNNPCGVTTDAHGNIYVANSPGLNLDAGGIQVFDPEGDPITQVSDKHHPCEIAVDSTGQLYVLEEGTDLLLRYEPTSYEPASGAIAYETEAEASTVATGVKGMALDPSNDHVYISHGEAEAKFKIEELLPDGAPANPPFTEDVFADLRSLAVWGQTHDIYSSGSPHNPYQPNEARVYGLDASTHDVILTLPDDSDVPDIDFGFTFGRGGIGVDQSNGDIYVDAVKVHHAVYQFDVTGQFVNAIELPNDGLKASEELNGIAIDNGADSPNEGYVFITSGSNAANSHLFAFAPREIAAPEIAGSHLVEAGETSVLLEAELNPHGAATGYHVEYGPADCSSNPCQSVPVPDASGGDGGDFKPVSVAVEGLEPGAAYHFRFVASNRCNPLDEDEVCVVEGPDVSFSTFPGLPPQACPNAALRTGPSARLADCRAYELVSPPNTNGRIPTATVFGTSIAAPSVSLADVNGQSVVFGTEGGTLPGSGGGGFYDTFRAIRSGQGWQTVLNGPTGVQSQDGYPGAVSADHAYSVWQVEKGALAKGQYLRGPDGGIEPVGIGSEGETTAATARMLSSGGAHLIFSSNVKLEGDAPPSPTTAIYDRGANGLTRVVSLLPDEATPAAGESAEYLGATESAVAFRLGGAIYVRLDNSETLKVVDDPATFGGLAADGSRVFYVAGGNAFAFDTAAQAVAPVGSGGQSTLVNVSADGTGAYFVSPLVLDPLPNDRGATAQPGAQNVYSWDADTEVVRFVASVEEEDVTGEAPPLGGISSPVGGIGLWTSDAVAPNQERFRGPANDSSRTSDDGRVLVFESRAQLTDYDNEGHSEIYRYDAATGELDCASCNPTGAPPKSEARLESRYAGLLLSIPPVNALSDVNNLAMDGKVVYFQSADRLAAGDSDGRIDVYEWQAPGALSCQDPDGCIRLISGGSSSADDYLYGAGDDGTSVFFLSNDRLVQQDPSNTYSIYAARVGGGFAPPPAAAEECEGEACQGPAGAPPQAPSAGSAGFVGPANPVHAGKRHRCPKGKHRERRKGRSRCVKAKPKGHRPKGRGNDGRRASR